MAWRDVGWTIGLIIGVAIAQASSQCTSGTCANGNCKWRYTGYVCACDVGYQNLYGNQSVCVDYDECRFNTMCPDGWCINYDGSYECKCNYGFKQTPDRKGCAYDSSTPFTNTYGFRNFLTSIGYTNPDMYLAPTPAKPQQHPQPPEIYAPQSPGFHAPQPPEIHAPQPPEIHAPQPPEIHYNPQPTPIHYGSQQNPSQYNPRSNPSEYNPQQNPSQRNPQPSTTTPVPVDADPTDAPQIEAQEPTPVNQRIDQNLQMMWEDPYGPQRPVFLDRSPVPPNVPRSLPPSSNQAPNPQSPTLPESNAPMAFPNQVPSFTNQITDFPTSQNQQSWIEALGPKRPAFLDQPLTHPPHQVNDPKRQFYQQGSPMRGDHGLVPTDAMGYPVSVPTQENVLWNSDPQQQFPVNYGPNPNTGEVLVAPPNPIPGAEQVPNMPLSPEYTQPPNNSPYFYSYPTLDINTGTPPSKFQMNPQSVPMASSDVPIVSQSMSQYQVPFSQANPYMPPNPYQNPESNFGPEYNQWQHPYPSYPTYDPYQQVPYGDTKPISSNSQQTGSQVSPLATDALGNEESVSQLSIAGEIPPTALPLSTTSSPTSEAVARTLTLTTAEMDVSTVVRNTNVVVATDASAPTPVPDSSTTTSVTTPTTTTTTSAPDTSTTTSVTSPTTTTTTTSTPSTTTHVTTPSTTTTTTTTTTPDTSTTSVTTPTTTTTTSTPSTTPVTTPSTTTTTTTTSTPDTSTTSVTSPTTTTTTTTTSTPSTTSTSTTTTTTPPVYDTTGLGASTWVKQTGQNLQISLGVDLSDAPSSVAAATAPAASFAVQATGVPNDTVPVTDVPSDDAKTVTSMTKGTASTPTSTNAPEDQRSARQPITVPVLPVNNARFDLTNSQVSNNVPVRPHSPNIIPKQYILKIPSKNTPPQMTRPSQQPRSNYPPRQQQRPNHPPRQQQRPNYPPRQQPRPNNPPRQQQRPNHPPRQQQRPNYPPRQQQRPNYPPRRPVVTDTKSTQRTPQSQVIRQVKYPPNVQHPVRIQNQPRKTNHPLQLYPTPRQYPVTTRNHYVLNTWSRPGQQTRHFQPAKQHTTISRPSSRVPAYPKRQQALNLSQKQPKYPQKQHSTIPRPPSRDVVHQMRQQTLNLPQNQPQNPHEYIASIRTPQFTRRGFNSVPNIQSPVGTWTNTGDGQMYKGYGAGSAMQSSHRAVLARPTRSRSHDSWINADTADQANSFANNDVFMTLLFSQLLN